jgi:AraC-like DNA-binding protein/mannose-6-phosphate isomerase-like protein (cupin superfamily)
MELKRACIGQDGRHQLSFDNFHIPPRTAYTKRHCPHYLEISYIKSGRGVYLVEDREYSIETGDMFIFSNMDHHVIRDIYDEEEFVIMVIHFEPWFIAKNEGDSFDMNCLRIFFDRSVNFQNKLDNSKSATGGIIKLMFDIEEELSGQMAGFENMVKAKLMEMLTFLMRYYEYDTTTYKCEFVKSEIRDMDTVMRYINEHLQEEIRLEALAGIAYMNPSYFSTLFKKCNGISITEYIMRKRIYRAVELLKTTGKSVSQIAELCGFRNIANFYKAFRKVTGKIPKEFRREGNSED